MGNKDGLFGYWQMWLGFLLSLSVVRQTWGVGEGKYGYFSAIRNSEVLLQNAVWNVKDNGNVTQFSFLTCSDGELLYQTGASSDMLRLLLNNGTLEFHWLIANNAGNISLGNNLHNNQWYTLNTLRYLGNLYLNITQGGRRLYSASISNSTFRTYFSVIDLTGSVGLYVGRGFTGCLMEGPNVIFKDNTNGVQSTNVTWSTSSCDTGCTTGSGTSNQCVNYPCQHGTCVSVQDSYRCDCLHLFNGTNCENDLSQYGCAVEPCLNAGNCSSETNGNKNYRCSCAPGYTGVNCEFEIQECNYMPCQNGGECIEKVDGYECNCTGTGWSGTNCDVDIDECNTTDICGTDRCFNNPGSYTCGCSAGFLFQGTDCQDIDECQSNPCQNGGTCNNEVNAYTCDCRAGFTGTTCETDIDDCAGITCQGTHVQCEDGVNNYMCVCKAGYTGSPDSCVDIDECAPQPCQNGGSCTNLENNYTCACMPGFTGNNCDGDIDECNSNPCQNGATCKDRINGYNCTCAPGFEGQQCRSNIDDCAFTSQPCYNGGTCIDGVNNFTCKCVPGYTGDRCGTDIDECFPQPCGIHGDTCTQGVNSFKCTCKPGYTGKRCETEINECDVGPCRNGGTCSDLVNGYSCQCPPEFMGSTCNQIYDACDASLENCKNGANCTTTPPSQDFLCTCPVGFTGSQCENNIDDCPQAVCTAPFVCHDLVNSYRCACPSGFQGQDCLQEINECQSSPCKNGGTCLDGDANYTCICNKMTKQVPGTNQTFDSGFRGDNCEIDINECDNSPSICLYDGICENKPGNFVCACKNTGNGTYYTGSHCEVETSYCINSDAVQQANGTACFNGGTCRGVDRGFECDCAPGWTDPRCRTNIDECESNPCEYNGTCIDGIAKYTCACIPGITGDNCETNINDCIPDPCFNGGNCTDGINSYECNCSDTGFKGDNCTINIDDCEPAPCYHGATCRDGVKEYFCDCNQGYKGVDCQVDINECAINPCKFNSPCLQRSNETLYDIDYPGFEGLNFTYATAAGYLCQCVRGSEGVNCEKNIDDCKHDNCNNGTCIDLLDAYKCDCFPGYTGQYCETEIDECEPRPCQHASTCVDKIADYDCNCVPYDQAAVAYAGKNCSFELTACLDNECHNGATCRPYLINETRATQDYECLCGEGFTGRYCNLSTTVSFNYSAIESRLQDADLDNLEISFKFRTTLTDVVLVSLVNSRGNGLFFSLELQNGGLVLQYHSDASGTMTTATIPGVRFNDGSWQHVTLTKHSGLYLQVTSPLCRVPADCRLTLNYSNTTQALGDLKFGNVHTGLLDQTVSRGLYVGCMEDVTVQGTRLTMAETYSQHSFTNLVQGCLRVDQCHKTTCNQKGDCVDLWNRFRCDCFRPNLGQQCESSYVAATFSYGATDASYAVFNLNASLQASVQQGAEISLFFRSRQPDGLILFFGNVSGDYVTLELTEGRVGMRYKLCSQESFQVTPHDTYADGNQQFVRLEKQGTSLQLVAGDAVENVTVPGCTFTPQTLTLGGINTSNNRLRRETITAPLTLDSVSSFKGTIQDPRLNTLSLQFFPLSDPSLSNLGVINMTDSTRLVESEVTDPVCNLTSPCENNSTCEDVFFNDYKCNCLLGYRGKNCSELDFCVTGTCPDGSRCQSLMDGFECISSATFDGGNSFASYIRSFSDTRNIKTISFKFRTLAYNGKHLLRVAKDSGNFYKVGLVGRRLVTVYKVDGSPEVSLTADHDVSDSVWYRAVITDEATQITLSLYHTTQESDAATQESDATTQESDDATQAIELTSVTANKPAGAAELSNLLNSSGTSIFLGDRVANSRNPNYQGCLTEARIGGILLPFFTDNQFVNNTSTQKFELASIINVVHGCVAGLGCDNSGCVEKATNTCEASYYSQVCHCRQGYTGRWCQELVDYCDIDGCLHGQCVNRLDGPYCSCPPGYTGTRCEEDVNECANNATVCHNNGSCQNENGTFTCSCGNGFTGEFCEKSLARDCSDLPCANAVECNNITVGASSTFNCTCSPGYEGDLCDRPIDYCSDLPCQNGGTCISSASQQPFLCSCPTGFTGGNCEENVNDCVKNNCKNNGTCIDAQNSYTCDCNSSVYWEGPHCDIDIDECDRNQPCQNTGTCINKDNGFTCRCDQTGYQGTYCDEDVDECAAVNPICQNNANCTNTVGSYDCNCTLGYTGQNCAQPNCSDVPCQNSSCMVTASNTWKCDCPPYYEGVFCEIRGPCADEPCNRDNTRSTNGCEQDVDNNTYTCNCKTGWTGKNCTKDFNECTSASDNSCQNGATCVNTAGAYTCTCALGYTGSFCQENIDECSSKPCQNDGYCIDGIGQYECNCTGTGYGNLTCSVDVDECLRVPCLYGGTCVNTVGSFTCTCADGYEGTDCSVKAEASMADNIVWYIVGPCVAVVLILIVIGVIWFLMCVRKRRATRGDYSPSRQEVSGSRVELGNVLKKPPLERLI